MLLLIRKDMVMNLKGRTYIAQEDAELLVSSALKIDNAVVDSVNMGNV
jgi:hypothetical protein